MDIKCSYKFNGHVDGLRELAIGLSEAIGSLSVSVSRIDYDTFRFIFADNILWFEVVDYKYESGAYTLEIRLRSEDSCGAIWVGKYRDAQLDGIRTYAKVHADLYAETQGRRGTEDEAPVEEATHGVASIVPSDITQLRVVALKHNNEVIAFRFKTDKGAFDMRKDVAQGFGLSGFKADKFITLESVNGWLMSKSERESRQSVPDVSDCPEDCKRLVSLVFELS